MSTSTAFAQVKDAAESLRNAEFHLGLLPEKPTTYDGEAVRTHLTDVRIALGHVAVALAEVYAQSRAAVLAEVAAERARQDAKWGQQNHPDGAGALSMPLEGLGFHSPHVPAREVAEASKIATDSRARAGIVTWRDILLEEVFEALAEDDASNLRTELIQVAAVASQWVEAIDRRAER